MKSLLIRLPETRVQQIEALIRRGFVANKAEAVREAVRDYLEAMPK